MNEAFEKLIKFNYYKNRIFTTIGLIIGLFNPLLGFPIVAITYYFYKRNLFRLNQGGKSSILSSRGGLFCKLLRLKTITRKLNIIKPTTM